MHGSVGRTSSPQAGASSPSPNPASGVPRSSHRISDGTTTRITASSSAYLTTTMPNGNAPSVITTTTGLKLGELNRNPSATSTRPLPRVMPQAVGTAQLAQTPIGTPTNAPLSEFRYRLFPIFSG